MLSRLPNGNISRPTQRRASAQRLFIDDRSLSFYTKAERIRPRIRLSIIYFDDEGFSSSFRNGAGKSEQPAHGVATGSEWKSQREREFAARRECYTHFAFSKRVINNFTSGLARIRFINTEFNRLIFYVHTRYIYPRVFRVRTFTYTKINAHTQKKRGT